MRISQQSPGGGAADGRGLSGEAGGFDLSGYPAVSGGETGSRGSGLKRFPLAHRSGLLYTVTSRRKKKVNEGGYENNQNGSGRY